MLFDPKEKEKYTLQGTVSPKNFPEENPERLWFQTNMTESDVGGGWTRYEMKWRATAAHQEPTMAWWFWIRLSDRPPAGYPNPESVNLRYSVRSMCVERTAENRAAPTAPASYNEKFVPPPVPAPPTAELTKQTGCPWNAGGAQTWESVFGTKTNGIRIPDGATVVAGASSFVVGKKYGVVRVPPTSALVLKDEAITWTVKGIVVEGALRVGAPTCRVQGPIKITFWGDKTDPDSTLDGYGTKGIAAHGAGAAVDLFGRRYFPSWSRLARPARAGDDRAYLQDKVNWLVGQEVVLTTTVWDDTEQSALHQNEVMTVHAVSPDGRVVQFTQSLAYAHYAGGEEDAEFGFGGHSYFSDNVVRDTYFRCYVIHGTHDVVETQNVAYNARGNCFYVEDGVEENNTISHNIAIHPPASSVIPRLRPLKEFAGNTAHSSGSYWAPGGRACAIAMGNGGKGKKLVYTNGRGTGNAAPAGGWDQTNAAERYP
eukprot:gene32518-948_t